MFKVKVSVSAYFSDIFQVLTKNFFNFPVQILFFLTNIFKNIIFLPHIEMLNYTKESTRC